MTSAAQPPEVVTIATGESRPIVHRWPDGSYTCPWCGGTVSNGRDAAWATGQCANPGCFAFPGQTVEWIRRRRAERAARDAEERERRARHERQMAALDETRRRDAARWATLAAEAEARGACLECLRKSNWRSGTPRFVRHRAANYHDR